METDAAAPKRAQLFGAEPILLDCYTELIAYTGYLVKQHPGGSFAYESVAETFKRLVDRSKTFAGSFGFSEDQWREGFFPVCACIDEAILCSDWDDRLKWERAQLQRQYFNTTSAGGEFYTRLEQLDPAAGDIRGVYEFCMTLGFKGRYYQPSDIGKLEDIHYTHLKRVTENVDLIYPEELFPDAYETVDAGKKRKKNKWKRVSLFSPTAVLLPVLLFVALYYLFNRLLNETVSRYFGSSF